MRPTAAHLDLEALRHNFRLAARLGGGGRTLAVIKADAYGHGAVTVARALADLAPAFGVACLEEAVALREAGIRTPLLVLGGFRDREELREAAARRLWLMLESGEQVEELLAAAPGLPGAVGVWLEVETGMHRLGLPAEQLASCYRRLRACPAVAGEVVVATHLACADDPEDPMTARQLARFRAALGGLDAPASIANSAALLAFPEARAHWNRPGYLLYGNSPFAKAHPAAAGLRPVLSLRSRIIALRRVAPGEAVGYGASWRAPRPLRLATVPVGYADGYPRTAPSGTPVWVAGRRAPLVGRVSMDLITVDVTDVPEAAVGAEVELWGAHLSVNEVAAAAGTIGYELLVRLSPRVPRLPLPARS
ncbi:MAG: alanine racemase [Porticoccaceae bacterium]|nr:MAG: alanine racemase [Porticoccaceae bacterium]